MTPEPMGPLGPVVITAREIYDQLVRVADALGVLATRIDRLADQHADSRSDIADHETRLRALERARWPLPSIAVLVSVAAFALNFLLR